MSKLTKNIVAAVFSIQQKMVLFPDTRFDGYLLANIESCFRI